MSRVTLIHWNRAEAGERAAQLRAAGYEPELPADLSSPGLRVFRDNPPAAFVIDLSRVPSHGRAVATFLRQQKVTRQVPIVFAGGEPEKVDATRALLPDAVYTEWSRIRGALRNAIRRPPAKPAVPGTMQEYSATPLPKKLGIRAGTRVALLGAPADFRTRLGALPEDVRLRDEAPHAADLILLFAKSRKELEQRFPAAARIMADKGGLWIAWPKRASGTRTDLTQANVRAFGLAAGLVDYKICAIDETWSGLLFARRKAG